jgi:hypothetical protein
MFCQRCGMDNREGSQFCRGCARPMFAAQTPPFNQGFAAQPPQFNQGFAAQPQVSSGSSGRAVTSMLLSILGLIFCGWFTSIPGMILGRMEMNAIREGRASQAGAGLAKTGFYLGLGVTAIYGLIGGIYILLLVFGSASY